MAWNPFSTSRSPLTRPWRLLRELVAELRGIRHALEQLADAQVFEDRARQANPRYGFRSGASRYERPGPKERRGYVHGPSTEALLARQAAEQRLEAALGRPPSQEELLDTLDAEQDGQDGQEGSTDEYGAGDANRGWPLGTPRTR